MARLIHSPMGSGPQGPFEQKLIEALVGGLPDDYRVLPNFSIKQQGQPSLEYDAVVFAPHAVFVVEAKEWYGRLTGDDTEWLLNQQPKKCPLWLVDLKCKVLKSRFGALGNKVWVDPLFVVPDGIHNLLTGNWASHVCTLKSAIAHLVDPQKVRYPGNLVGQLDAMQGMLQGGWAARRREQRRRYGGWEVTELLIADEDGAEYRAKRALISDSTPYRIRTWHVSPYDSDDQRMQLLEVIKRPTEALARIGRHPNLLPVLAFDENPDDNEFYEVTEWSDFGTLHGYLKNPEREPLTVRERLEIAAGVASALEAVHASDLVHRNVSPATILIGFDRQARLTDFDRAYIENSPTVFERTKRRGRDVAYVAPELSDVTDYDFDASADMYSLGVVLFELICDRVPFTSPEAALAEKGRLPILPSQAREGVDARLDKLVSDLLNVQDFHKRPSAAETHKLLKTLLGSSNGVKQPEAPPPAEIAPPKLEAGQIIDGVFRIDAELGSGSFSRVYKVFHLDHGRYYAMKLLKKSSEVDLLLREYNEIGSRLPQHRHIARMFWMGRLAPPLYTPYILNEYVEGETLERYCDGTKMLAWRDIRNIGLQVLDALEALHPRTAELNELEAAIAGRTPIPDQISRRDELREQVRNSILHRDIKPSNILLEDPSHDAKLIDFNIASRLAGAHGKVGTPRYWAPDRGQPDWRPDMDLFSLGVVLYELVAHQHPFPNNDPEYGEPIDPRTIESGPRISKEVADFLLKSISSKGSARFQSAAEMSLALASISTMYAPTAATSSSSFTGITLEPGEVNKPNYNPYVTRLLTLHSQARRNNGGTRGLDEIARLTYVKTRLDERLAPAIADGRFRLVIVTGNAGDGKTAFLQQVEAFFRGIGSTIEPLATGNGARWTHAGLNFETNYDGSQDEGDTHNDDVLSAFLEPFAGTVLSKAYTSEIRLIAINEGRLLDFLEHSTHAVRFIALRHFVLTALEGKYQQDSLLLVNLNLRAVAAGREQSLVDRQLNAMLRPELWEACSGCSHQGKCPIKHNADTLRDTHSGSATRARIRKLFEVLHLRRRAHVTIRDLRSALSWLLFQDHSCDDIDRLLTSEEAAAPERIADLYYPEAFSTNGGRLTGTVEDRLVALLRQTDIGLVNEPQIDRRLDYDPLTAVPWMTYDDRSAYGWEVVSGLRRNSPRSTDEASLSDLIESRRSVLRRFRRWAYFERRDDGWEQMLPYGSWRLLSEVIYAENADQRKAAAAILRDRVLEAMSLSEGLRGTQRRQEFLALRVSRIKKPTVRSYRLFPTSAFRIQVANTDGIGDFLEYAADSVDLVSDDSIGSATLRISLDLLEMMELIRGGYRPNPSDLQGLFVNLLIFRNALLSLPFDRVMVSADDDSMFEVSSHLSSGGAICLNIGPYRPVEVEAQKAPA